MLNLKSQNQNSNFKSKTGKIIIYFLMVLLIIFNFYLYRGEFKVLSDPNDNIFQYALIDEAKSIWKNVLAGKLSPLYLFDSFNERWAEGFSLSLYYNHLPQNIIALSSFLVPIDTYKFFVILRTLILVLLPVTFFLAMKILEFSNVYALFTALFSQAIITDGLYGIDLSSFLWRGWGLSSQLFAVFLLPLAFAYTIAYLNGKKSFIWAFIFNFLLAEAHLGIFLILALSYPFYLLFSLDNWKPTLKKIIFLAGFLFICLFYFLYPQLFQGQYRNFSLWDSIWKFNSWGINQILIWLGNGDLFDFNRFPVITLLIFVGAYTYIKTNKKILKYLTFLFIFYLALFTGRTSLGNVINLIPGFSEYHLHRIIVMVHFVGILLAGWGGVWIFEKIKYSRLLIIKVLGLIAAIILIFILEKPVFKYTEDNNIWINKSNVDYEKEQSSYNNIIDKLRKLPSGRVYTGRPGNWGRDFKIGDTQIYMALSRDGFSTVGFLPESWSPNSDAEQFFNEDDLTWVQLYNVRYLIYPDSKKAPDFAEIIQKSGKLTLYQVPNDGYFGFGKSNIAVVTNKNYLANIVHLWQGKYLKTGQFPEINLDEKQFSVIKDKAVIHMTGLNNFRYYSGGSLINTNIWQTNPLSLLEKNDNIDNLIVKKQETVLINGYETKIQLKKDCPDCLVILKESFHPNWQVTVNKQITKTYPVFPFYIGIPVNKQGVYEIKAIYKPNIVTIIFLSLTPIFFLAIPYIARRYK